jgi:hypothetical protein
VIGYIKSLAAVLLDSEADSDALLKRSVHDEMQTFVQFQMRQVCSVGLFVCLLLLFAC